jgi:hypothetical protein
LNLGKAYIILVDDSLQFILLIRSDNNDVKFCNLAEADFDDGSSFGNDTASLIVIWRFDRDSW